MRYFFEKTSDQHALKLHTDSQLSRREVGIEMPTRYDPFTFLNLLWHNKNRSLPSERETQPTVIVESATRANWTSPCEYVSQDFFVT